jgi:hypothetical protein
MNLLKRRVTVGLFGVALAAAACGGGSSSSTSTSAKPSRGFTAPTAGDTTTVTYKGVPLTWGQTTLMPNLVCPPDHPYMLNQKYNTDTSFRLDPGISFSNWSWGFDASVWGSNQFLFQQTPRGQARIGLKGNQAYDLSSVSYWGTDAESAWTLTLHCTSDLNKATG